MTLFAQKDRLENLLIFRDIYRVTGNSLSDHCLRFWIKSMSLQILISSITKTQEDIVIGLVLFNCGFLLYNSIVTRLKTSC